VNISQPKLRSEKYDDDDDDEDDDNNNNNNNNNSGFGNGSTDFIYRMLYSPLL